MGRRFVVIVLALMAVSVVGCSGGDDGPAVVLDGRARRPDAEGVVRQVSHSQITVDERRYRVSRTLQAFSTYTLEAVPIVGRRSQYVQLGLDGDEVVWLAAFGAVVRPPGADPAVYYTGVFRRVERRRAVFRDGSTVLLGPGVDAPAPGTRVRVEIDPVRHRARNVVPV